MLKLRFLPNRGEIDFMKTLISLVTALTFLQPALAEIKVNSFYDHKVKAIDGKDVALMEYKGKVALVVNTASKCGYTGQYEGLEKLYKTYQTKGLVVLGFPSNDFLSQEPGTNEEIAKFCKFNFGVTFPLFEKNPVKGKEKQPVYQFLTSAYKGKPSGEVGWNFEKFLVDKSGNVVARFKSSVKPNDSELIKKIEELLK
jgi:glutathione peroxidase